MPLTTRPARPVRALFAVAWLAVASLAGCKDKTEPPAPVDAAATPPSAAPSAPAADAAPEASAGDGALAGDASGVLALTWKLSAGEGERVMVALAAGGETLALGGLDGASDDGPGGVGSCAMKRSSAAQSTLECGAVPAYNFYTAALQKGELVVTLSTGVDMEPGSDRVKVVLRRPTTATALKASGPASKGLSGNCRPGYVQRTLESPCLRQCLKGTECRGADKCVFVNVKGLDGDHRVHACVAPGK